MDFTPREQRLIRYISQHFESQGSLNLDFNITNLQQYEILAGDANGDITNQPLVAGNEIVINGLTVAVNSSSSSNWDTAYNHSQIVAGNPHNLDTDDVPEGSNQYFTNERAQDAFGAMLSGTQTLISVTYDDVNGEIDFIVDEANIDHQSLAGIVASEHRRWENSIPQVVHADNIPSLPASIITTGTFADARISQSSVTQHESAINHDNLANWFANQHRVWENSIGQNVHLDNIPNLPASRITSGTFANGRISQSSVTQHEAALTIAESQITDGSILARLADNETITGAWEFQNNVLISPGVVGTDIDQTLSVTNSGFVGISIETLSSDTGRPRFETFQKKNTPSADTIYSESHSYNNSVNARRTAVQLVSKTTDITSGAGEAVYEIHVHTGGSLSKMIVLDSNGVSLENNPIINASIAAGLIDSGTLAVARIPNLPASQITSGTFADGRISQSSVTQHQSAINHDALSGFVANEHINHTSVSISGGTGLSGGGTINISRTLNLNIPGMTALTSGLVSTDELAVSDGGTHKRMDISVLQSYMQSNLSFTNDTNDFLTGLSFATGTGILTATVQNQANPTVDLDGRYSLTSHTHPAGDITSGTFANARISQSSVTQHEAALTITESQISDLGNYAVVGHSHSTSDITSGTFANARISQSSVTQHEAALSIGGSQITGRISNNNLPSPMGDVTWTAAGAEDVNLFHKEWASIGTGDQIIDSSGNAFRVISYWVQVVSRQPSGGLYESVWIHATVSTDGNGEVGSSNVSLHFRHSNMASGDHWGAFFQNTGSGYILWLQNNQSQSNTGVVMQVWRYRAQ